MTTFFCDQCGTTFESNKQTCDCPFTERNPYCWWVKPFQKPAITNMADAWIPGNWMILTTDNEVVGLQSEYWDLF